MPFWPSAFGACYVQGLCPRNPVCVWRSFIPAAVLPRLQTDYHEEQRMVTAMFVRFNSARLNQDISERPKEV